MSEIPCQWTGPVTQRTKSEGRMLLKLTVSWRAQVSRLAGLLFGAGLASAPVAGWAQEMLPEIPREPVDFVGRTAAESPPPTWPGATIKSAPEGAPNVFVLMLDDVGFGVTSTFGGPVPTPNLDALAAGGLRYNQFNTAALCSATRAALLTGRFQTNVNVANANNLATGYDGYTTVIPKSAGSVAEILKQNGYSTAAFGKWHLIPEWEESQAGPFDHWPTGMGFQHYYGFLGADASQWAPALVENTTNITRPNDPNYILDRDLADRAVKWISEQKQIAPDRPFFVYFTPGTAHAPHHAPAEWLAKFRGKFDGGWDKMREETFARQKTLGIIPRDAVLTPRPAFLPAWASLTPERRQVYALHFEAFAAQIAFLDSQLGRVLDQLRADGTFDNTLFIYINGDNGSSAEGGPEGLLYEQSFINRFDDSFEYMKSRGSEIGGPNLYSHYAAPFAWAGNTPFQYYKQTSHFGGVRNGMVVSWPARIRGRGDVRSQFHYVTDVVPTILEAAGVQEPSTLNGIAQKPLDGISFGYSFDNPAEPSHRRTQVFSMLQNLAIYNDGWWAGTRPAKTPWELTRGRKISLDDRVWELYNISNDFSQSRDLSKSNPAKLKQMQQLFWAEAARNNILPIHDINEGAAGRPSLTGNRTVFKFLPGLTRLPEGAAPRFIGRSYSIEADVVTDPGSDGVLMAQGGRFGGHALYIKDGRPMFHYNAIGQRQYVIRSPEPLSPGAHKVAAAFAIDSDAIGAGGTLTLSVDGQIVATGRVDRTLSAWVSHSEGLDVGEDTITPVTEDYAADRSKFSGTLKQVTVTLK